MLAAMSKRILFINRRGPYGSLYAQEALEIALVGGAFDQRICLALIDDGVFLLRSGQNTEGAGLKRFTAAYRALSDFDIHRVYVEQESLAARGMNRRDLMDVPAGGEGSSLLEVVSSRDLAGIIAAHDILLNQ